MTVSPPPHALHLRVGDELVFATYYAAATAPLSTAVLICPPFGWEEVCSYRSLRDWARDLAERGYSTLRIDLPGTGDSSGTSADPLRLDAWSDAVCSTAAWLKDRANARCITAIGIGLGGLVVSRAASGGAPIEEAVLWATPSRGHTLVRQLRAFARLEREQVAVAEEADSALTAATGLEAGGFAISEETAAALEALDLAELSYSAGRLRRALLLGRDGIEAEARLRAHFEQSGVAVTLAGGAGYGAMTAEPQLSRPPTETFARVAAWLNASPTLSPVDTDTKRATPVAPNAHAAASDSPEIELTIGGARIRETTMQVEQPFGHLFGILSQPLENPTTELGAVLLNAGAIRRIGPNRMWVDIARRWAARGVPTLRLDIEGIGDADGDAARFSELAELYVPELVDQVGSALDALEERAIATRFVLVGLCSGAYWSFHRALQDERVAAALMLNPQALFWDASQETVRDLREAFMRRSSWLRLLRGRSSAARAGVLLRELPAGVTVMARRRLSGHRIATPGDEVLQDALRRLDIADKRALFVFSGEEPLYEELDSIGAIERLQRWPRVELVRIPGRDHTLRPLAARRGAFAALDRALERELAPVTAKPGLAPGAELL